MKKAEIGIIGGSGFYNMEGLEDVEEVAIKTPFGEPSAPILLGSLDGRRLAFLARHGKGHKYLPTEVPFRANIYAMKVLGVERIISVSAVGSLKEEIKPLDMVLPDYFFDLTKKREATFFGNGIAAHVSFSHPICPVMQDAIYRAAEEESISVRRGGTYVCIEGPQFSTKAESEFYRKMGFDVIGMTNATEAKLAREAEICYVTLAMVTDYDCWHEEEEEVSVELVVENLNRNIESAKKVIRRALKLIPEDRKGCQCATALKNAIITAKEVIPEETREKLRPIIGRYL
ncbi:MAG: S-methyl-5'-thioadenosine phosphorylase [Candidatus Aminicenantes bacterium]|nr:S-methyl-5'-thioadenosine phosphorylase [Candidatus Aminicenantes bacterium]